MKNMKRVKDEVFDVSEGRKYGFVNYQFLKFDKNNDLKTFHIEFRHLDGLPVPSALSAFACLWHAIVIKAVEISRYGILEMESNEWLKKASTIKKSMLNNVGDWGAERFSDTSKLHQYEDILRDESLDLVRQVKHILLQKGPSYDVLESIALNPLSYRRENGDSWEEIEEQLKIIKGYEEKDGFATFIDELIDLRGVCNQKDIPEWIKNVAQIVIKEGVCDKTVDSIATDVEMYINTRQSMGELLWSDSLGSFVSV
jgi:hypothetical protein